MEITYVWNLKYGTNELIDKKKKKKNRLTDIENRLVVAERGGKEWDRLGVWG